METSIHELSNGICLTLHPAVTGEKSPAIILCHGFCGIRGLALPEFAEHFSQAGFTTMVFDYRGFGDSGGERGRLVPNMQVDDISSVVAWARGRPEVDGGHISLWGTSLGGCHVFGVAARDAKIKCIVSQVPFADGDKVVTGKMTAVEKQMFLLALERRAERKRVTGREMFVSATQVLADAESKAYFETNSIRHPRMDVKIPFLTVKEILGYKPALDASQVQCPTLVVIADHDTIRSIRQSKGEHSMMQPRPG